MDTAKQGNLKKTKQKNSVMTELLRYYEKLASNIKGFPVGLSVSMSCDRKLKWDNVFFGVFFFKSLSDSKSE